jgi:periplasmic protein TonB
MNKELKNQTYLDILFEGKNKAYGAYELRSNYNKRAGIAIAIMTSLCIIIAVSAELTADTKKDRSIYSGRLVEIKLPTQEVIVPKKKKEEIKKPTERTKITKTIQTKAPILNRPKISPVVVKDLTNIPLDTNTYKPDQPVSYNPLGKDTGVAVALGPTATVTPQDDGEGKNGLVTKKNNANDDIKDQGELDELPEYPGGLDMFRAKVGDLIEYPISATENKIEGIVQLEFVVDEKGLISHVKVKSSVGYGCDEEALRVFNIVSKTNWKPAKINGVAVKTYYQFPINYTLVD